MFYRKQKSHKERGSMLFLAMVVMGIMLILGVGVATLLLRQIEESEVSEDTAVAFYVKETALDGFSVTDTWVDVSWSGSDKKIEYKVVENEGVNEVAVRIDDDKYYYFGEGESGGGGGEDPSGALSIYYENAYGEGGGPWTDVSMLYGLHDSGGNLVGSWETVNMTSSGYGDWQTYDFPTLDSSGTYIRIGFCETGASSCTTDSEYQIYKYDGGCFFTKPVFSKCNTDGTTSIYYENAYGEGGGPWTDVSMLYGLHDSGGNLVGSWETVNMTSSGYGDWQTYDFPTLDSSGTYIRIGFCETGASSCTTDSEYQIYKYDGGCFFTKPVFSKCN